MEKSKLLQVIAAIMITSMAVSLLSFSTTTVSATSGTATLTPSSARANTRILFTVTVTNTTSSDNIDNVLVKVVSTGLFSQPIGENENFAIAADNIENAVAYLTQAGENMILAEDNKKSSGPNIKATGDNLALITEGMLAVENGDVAGAQSRLNVVITLTNVQSYLQLVADAIDNDVENLEYIYTYLDSAGASLRLAAGHPDQDVRENLENVKRAAAENLDNAGDDVQSAATAIRHGDFETAGLYLIDAGDNIYATGDAFTQVSLVAALHNAGSQLRTAGLALRDAGDFLDNAGEALGVAENYLTSAGIYLVDHAVLGTAGANLGIAALLLENAGVAMLDNLPAAGENLKLAADNLENVALELGVAFGKDGENAAATNIDYAGDNLRNKEKTGITTAGNELKNAATNLSDAASTMAASAGELQSNDWTLTDGNSYVLFSTDNENIIIGPSGSKTFSFLWTTPNITTETNYTLSVMVAKEGSSTWDNLGGFTLSVDGKAPSVEINVTQDDLTVNLVGNKLDSGNATITITASEPLSELGTVYVENENNLVTPIAGTEFTANDNNTVFTYNNLVIGEWDDNTVVVRLASAKDVAGNENTAGMENIITVDTRAPVFTDNGLATLVAGMSARVKAGTTTEYTYVDNDETKDLTIIVSDNALDNTDNAGWVTSVVVNGTAATRNPTIGKENIWGASVTLSEGLNVVVVTATDHTGNTESDNVEIYIDTQLPTITFNTISLTGGDVAWTDNIKTNDNKPTIKVTVLDPGYAACTGLGVAYENLWVYLDLDDNYENGTLYKLENTNPWVVATGVFENTLDNFDDPCTGLPDNKYWVIVVANDNLNENVIAKRSFIIDTSAPIWTTTLLKAAITVKDSVTNVDLLLTAATPTTTTKKTSWLIVGGAQKPRSTIKVWVSASTAVLMGTTTASTTLNSLTGLYNYELTVTLSEGTNQSVYIEEVDNAGNSSGRVLLGTYTVDATPPVIALSSPVDGTSTDAAQVTVSGTIIDAVVTDPQLLTVSIDCTGAVVAKTVHLNPDGSFSTTVPLVEGTNKINVVAADGAVTAISGNQTITTRTVERTVTPLTTYAIILVVVALILAAIAIFRKEMK